MKNDKVVSQLVINRLPRYYRLLGDLLNSGVTRVSSRELASIMKNTASQIRQDLNCFGGFGQQGYGYNVELLRSEIGNILGLNELEPTVLIGTGNLGHTIAMQVDLTKMGFRLIGAFDFDPQKIGQSLVGLTVSDIADLERFCLIHRPKAAIICVPNNAAASLAPRLVSAGIVGFWNFSSYDFMSHHPGVTAVNVHLADSVMTLSYMVKHLGSE